MGSATGYDAEYSMQIRKPANHYAHDGPSHFQLPGTVAPFETAYEERSRFEEQRNMQLGYKAKVAVEVAAELEPAMADA